MPNYLARVAAAGARTSTPIRPPVSAPPIMPGSGLFEPAWSAELEAEVVVPTLTANDRQADARPAPSSLTFEATSTRAPTPDLPPTTAAASPAAAQLVHGPIDPPPPAAPSSPRVEPQREIEPPKRDDIVRVPRALRLAPILEILPATTGAQDSANPPVESPAPPLAPISAARSRAAVRVPASALPQAASVQRDANPPAAAPLLAAVRQPPTPVLTEPLPDPAVAAEASPVTPAAVVLLPETPPLPGGLPSPAVPMQREGIAVAAAIEEQRPDPGFTGLPLPPAQPGPPAPPVAAQRQSRITIGRLDVQVTNHPPPPAVRPARLPSPPDQDILAGLYLDRFRLTP
jgi:hypothetical protein